MDNTAQHVLPSAAWASSHYAHRCLARSPGTQISLVQLAPSKAQPANQTSAKLKLKVATQLALPLWFPGRAQALPVLRPGQDSQIVPLVLSLSSQQPPWHLFRALVSAWCIHFAPNFERLVFRPPPRGKTFRSGAREALLGSVARLFC